MPSTCPVATTEATTFTQPYHLLLVTLFTPSHNLINATYQPAVVLTITLTAFPSPSPPVIQHVPLLIHPPKKPRTNRPAPTTPTPKTTATPTPERATTTKATTGAAAETNTTAEAEAGVVAEADSVGEE